MTIFEARHFQFGFLLALALSVSAAPAAAQGYTPEQEQALVDFVEGGKGLVAIHSASYMFIKSDRYIPMVGGQFLRHGAGEFAAEVVQPNHPAMQGLEPFTTCAVHVGAASDADRERLREVVEATGRAPKQGRDFDSQAHHTARSLCASLKKPEGDSALVRDLRSRGYRL